MPTQLNEEIGTNEFARIIGAPYPEVSRSAATGLLHVVRMGSRATGRTFVLRRSDAERIAAAVNCGIPWRVAATLSDRIEILVRGGIRVFPLLRSQGVNARSARTLHRKHKKNSLKSTD